MIKKIFSSTLIVFKMISIVLIVSVLTQVSITKQNRQATNVNLNKTLDLHAMAIKVNQIQMSDKYYVLDTYVGDLTAYLANCPLCGGTLGCTGQNVLDGTTTYLDNDYGEVRIVASSSNLACGSIIQFESSNFSGKQTAIVLDRGVTGNAIDILVNSDTEAANIGRKQITYDILRFGWERKNI